MSIVIRVENVSKRYRLGTVGTQSLKGDFSRWWAKVNGKEDPLLKIGEKQQKQNVDFWALTDINFEIRQGEAVGIIGRNGAGKSTLLKILSRITNPTTGSVKIKGRIASLLEVGTGFNPELTGRENIFLNGAILGMRKREVQAKFDEIVDFSGVEKFIDTPVKRYSSGMYVRLAFAVAAHLESEILILDEVLAVGDTEFQKKCLGKMDDVTKHQGRTIIFVSHDMQSISTLTGKTLFLEKGIVKYKGETRDVINYYIESNKQEYILKNSIYIDEEYSESPKISKVEVFTSLVNNVQKNNDSFKVEITIQTPEPIKGACLSFQIVDLTERNFVHVWTFDSERPMCREAGVHLISCEIPKLRLYMGKYALKVYFTEPPGGKVFQILENICHFEVVMYENHREFKWQPSACAYLEDSVWDIKAIHKFNKILK